MTKLAEVLQSLEIDRETDGRWIADVTALPGVLCYGTSEGEARQAAIDLASRVLAERADHREL